MKEIIRKINSVFITIILLFFYFIVVGFAHVIYKLVVHPNKKRSSYWEEVDDKGLNIDYYQSPY